MGDDGLRGDTWMHARHRSGELLFAPLGLHPLMLCGNPNDSEHWEEHSPHEWLTHDFAFVRPDVECHPNVVQRVETVTWYRCPGRIPAEAAPGDRAGADGSATGVGTVTFRVEIDPPDAAGAGAVRLFDGDEELVMWDSAEWVDDPTVVAVIANAIVIGYTEGPDGLRRRLT